MMIYAGRNFAIDFTIMRCMNFLNKQLQLKLKTGNWSAQYIPPSILIYHAFFTFAVL